MNSDGGLIDPDQEPDLQVAYIAEAQQCGMCWETRRQMVEAAYDAKTKYGPWAYLCVRCFVDHGIGLGLGRGQRLIVGVRPAEARRPE